MTVPRLLFQSLMEDSRGSLLAEQALLAADQAKHELDTCEAGFMKRLREMRFELEGSAGSLADAIFTVTFWMQRCARFQSVPVKAEPGGASLAAPGRATHPVG